MRDAHVPAMTLPGLLPAKKEVAYMPPFQSELANSISLLNVLVLNNSTDIPFGP